MKELLIKEGRSIACFKAGDLITRVNPSIDQKEAYNENLGTTQVVETIKDGSYIGEPLKFVGVFNNQIWLERLNKTQRIIFGNKPIRLDLYSWSDGWDLFEFPKGFSIDDL